MRFLNTAAILLVSGLTWAHSPALAHVSGGEVELPEGGTLHELRITRISAFTVAQGITQPAVCGSTFACFQDEIHLPVVIDFSTGEIAIDATEILDENEAVVRMLFNTQSGPAELTFEPPCVNPDGCAGGTPIYLGTIDTAGNISFPSIGLSFDLFGFSPVTAFTASMGTGTTVDPADVGTEAQGEPLDFTTGNVVLEGVEFLPAPVVGTILQVNRIEAQIIPVPVPPVASRTLLRCQKKIQKEGAGFVKSKQRSLTRCFVALIACAFLDASGAGAGAGCVSDGVETCNKSVANIAKAELRLTEKILKSCSDPILAPNLVATRRGLGFGVNGVQCDAFGLGLGTKDSIADCILARLECSVEEMVALLEPRAGEVLAANGFGAFVDPNGCIPLLADGDAPSGSADNVLKCQSRLGKEGAKLVRTKQKALQKCISAKLRCELLDEIDGLEGVAHDECHAKADRTCTKSVARIDTAVAKFEDKIAKGCRFFSTIEAGLAIPELEPVCGTELPDRAAWVECLRTKLECAAEGVARSVEPRAEDVFADPNGGASALLDRFVCLTPSCGNGIVEEGEDCDPLFPNPDCSECSNVVCGDGIKDDVEECEDGNTDPGDGCSPTCTLECGNGVLDLNELCDDGDSHGGDGCSSDCRSDETCGNGIVDTLVGEVCEVCSVDCRSDLSCGNGVIDAGEGCDDGNTTPGDGCDASCAFEACSFSSVAALGTRTFSIDVTTTVSGQFISIFPLSFPIANITFTSGDFDFIASATDATGTAGVTLSSDVIVAQTNLAGGIQCLKFEAAGTIGSLHCCGGYAVGVSRTRDSNVGGLGGNGPSITLTEIGGGGPGDLLMAFQMSTSGAETPAGCATATYGSTFTQYWTTGLATGRVVQAAPFNPNNPTVEFTTSGQAFDCSSWTTTDDVGALVTPDTALNFIPGTDGGLLTIYEDEGGN